MRHCLLYLLLIGSGFTVIAQDTPVQLQIKPCYKEQAISLEDGPIEIEGTSLKIETIRFYISGISLWHKGELVWAEKNSYHLIDLEDPESCTLDLIHNSGLPFDQINLNIGVDSLMNVSGAMGGDLDPMKGMYWTWNSGYINFKLEGNSPECPSRNNAFQFHLGGYTSPNSTLRNLSFQIPPDEKIMLRMDISRFLMAVDLNKQHHIMSPGPDAAALSTLASKMFSINAE